MACHCSICGQPVDCGDEICAVCECPDGLHCEIIIKRVKPNLFKVRLEDGSYTLKWIPASI